jgi:methylthioribose-1-phosphate isomerase
MSPAVAWKDGRVVIVDQRLLPHEERELTLNTVDELIEAVRALAVRGAPALGLAGAYGVALACHRHDPATPGYATAVSEDAARLAAARPTAVQLGRGVAEALSALELGPLAVLERARQLHERDAVANCGAAERAAAVVDELLGGRTDLRLLTHCHTGRLATGSEGTALGAILDLARRGRIREVLVGETRPLLQGARLTAWELARAGVPYRLLIDSAAAAAMARGMVDCVLVGADRVAANGDTANKIGTYSLAVAAAHHQVPFVVVAPEVAWDGDLADGAGITVEERDAAEVAGFAGVRTAPPRANAFNPAFDVTPAHLISAIATDRRIFRPRRPAGDEIAGLTRELYARGWMPGTSGNVSVRLPDGSVLISASGRPKGELTGADTVRVDAASGAPTVPGGPRPSAETAVHTAIYRTAPDAGAVVHAHSPYATAVAALARPGNGPVGVAMRGMELLKGLGLKDPDRGELPVFPNWPDVRRIGDQVAAYLTGTADVPPAVLVADHGVTTWGRDLAQARDRLECVEALCHHLLLTRRDSPDRSTT